MIHLQARQQQQHEAVPTSMQEDKDCACLDSLYINANINCRSRLFMRIFVKLQLKVLNRCSGLLFIWMEQDMANVRAAKRELRKAVQAKLHNLSGESIASQCSICSITYTHRLAS